MHEHFKKPDPARARYVGLRASDGCQVVRIENERLHPVDPRLDLRNHSPTGFEWGYHGSGPAQLALALCADATGDDRLALSIYQQFKRQIIAGLPRDSWDLDKSVIAEFARLLRDPAKIEAEI